MLNVKTTCGQGHIGATMADDQMMSTCCIYLRAFQLPDPSLLSLSISLLYLKSPFLPPFYLCPLIIGQHCIGLGGGGQDKLKYTDPYFFSVLLFLLEQEPEK